MKPGRLENALKSFGRAPKCIKTLWPGSKMYWNPSAGLWILENVGSGLPKITKIYENPKNVIFSSQNRGNFDHWDGKIDSELIHQKKRNGSVLKFPRPVGIFESDLVWKWGTNLLLANSGKIIEIWKIRENRGNQENQ